MKALFGIFRWFGFVIVIVLLIASIALNVWFYTEISSLNAEVSHQLGERSYGHYQLPNEVISELRQNIGEMVDGMQYMVQEIQRLEFENAQYREAFYQIQREAERAQERGFWDTLLGLIFSLF